MKDYIGDGLSVITLIDGIIITDEHNNEDKITISIDDEQLTRLIVAIKKYKGVQVL